MERTVEKTELRTESRSHLRKVAVWVLSEGIGSKGVTCGSVQVYSMPPAGQPLGKTSETGKPTTGLVPRTIYLPHGDGRGLRQHGLRQLLLGGGRPLRNPRAERWKDRAIHLHGSGLCTWTADPDLRSVTWYAPSGPDVGQAYGQYSSRCYNRQPACGCRRTAGHCPGPLGL